LWLLLSWLKKPATTTKAMPSPDWEDLSEFFDPSVFATRLMLSRGGEVLGRVLCLFDDPSTSPQLGDFSLDDQAPRVTMPEKDATALGFRRGDVVAVSDREFDVMRSPDLDGTGVAVVILAVRATVYNAEA
jgi:hypothetical protein